MARDKGGQGRGRRRPGWSTRANEIVNRIFVYGTFRAGESARAMISGHVDRTRPATTTGAIYAMPEGYPGLVEADDGVVVGEVLDLNDLAAAFALLDAYEGEAYERTLRQVTLADGSQVYAWCYLFTDAALARTGEHIPDGDWMSWRGAQAS